MIELVRGLQYNYNGMKILKGQKLRLQGPIEAYLVETGAFQYVGTRRVMYVRPSTTTSICIQGKNYDVVENEPIDLPQEIGFDIVRLGFAKEVPVRTVIIESYDKMREALFIRNGGFGDLVLLYQALNYMFKMRPELDKIHLMTEERYYGLFENDKRFILHPLSNYEELAGKFKHILDLRMAVEGDPDTGSIHRMLLFIRLLGLSIHNKNVTELKEESCITIPHKDTSYDKYIKANTLVLNISSSRPERDLSKQTIEDLIDHVVTCKKISNIIILNDTPFVYNKHINKVNNLSGSTTVNEMIQIINKSKYYIGLDTGPSHLAGSFQKQGLVVGGPVNLHLRCSQYKNLMLIQNETMECVKLNTCYNCTKRPNPSLPGKCMEFTGKYLFDKLLEVI